MEKKSVGFIGGGRITKILLKAFADSNTEFNKIAVFDPNSDNFSALKNACPGIEVDSISIKKAAECDIVFVAVHPPVVMDVLSKIAPHLNAPSLLVSFAPKITMGKMKEALNGHLALARVNPSASGIIHQGMNPVAFDEGVNDEQQSYLLRLLGILGQAPIVAESKIEAYAVISAMGPTYFWFQLQHLKEMAMQFGMDESEAKEVISEMLKGTINTLFYSGIPMDEVIDLVPVKPIGEYEDLIKSYYSEKMNGIFNKIKPE